MPELTVKGGFSYLGALQVLPPGVHIAVSASGMGEGSCLSLPCLQSRPRLFENLSKLLKLPWKGQKWKSWIWKTICLKPNPNLCRGAPGKAFLYPKDGLEAQFKRGGEGKTQTLRDWTS